MKQRLITGVVAGALFLGLCLLGGWWFQLLLTAMALIGYYEFVKMTGLSIKSGSAVLGYAAVLGFMIPWEKLDMSVPLTWVQGVWLLMFLFLCITVFSKNKTDIRIAAMLFIGALYIGTGFSYMAVSRSAPDGHGLFWTFLLLCCIWGSDAGAYFVGKAIGRNKLWPAISPNKTVEGAAGGVLISIVIAVIFAALSSGLLTFGQSIMIGLVSAVVGQLGDLVQSAYKRVYGIKDSGTLLPGHGGILDRCDSWIIVFPFIHILTLLPYYQ
ncbi:phosphatidate cytidylyltransferase [Paenibacillus sp. HN-1]|uniref:phosphatidate cytidylyltransferase n=1 Tax=Paenibacillus TaxID=44249 RepID=UPI001CA7DEA6|nr:MULTISPECIES: phosphatidate cytidylyltransferase [Paenibacillus]MBY9081920.1 phosphatidate cytidylyltransferase [Paenibacillus sp. CGMCC 1.18879]MBY9085922.1 phosphatidate cytidylyltransferase [Paenibacillus sinensis]